MSGAGWLLQVIVLAILVGGLLSRWPRVLALWWLAVVGFLVWALGHWPEDRLVLILNHPLYMDEPLSIGRFILRLDMGAREAVRMMLVPLGLWAFIAVFVPDWGGGLAWVGLALLGGGMAAMTTAAWAMGWGAAVWAAAAVLPALGGHRARVHGVWQWMLPWLFSALLLFALLIWPDPNRAGGEVWRVQVLAVALMAWTGLVPFHVGQVNLTAGSRPMGSVWLWWSHAVLVLLFVRRLGFEPGMSTAVWRAAPVLQFVGVVTLLWAGGAAISTRDVGRLGAYAALYNWALVLSMWLALPRNEDLVRWTLVVRFVALVAVGVGLTALLRGDDERSFRALSGWARRRPWSVATWAVGVATLAGAPFTPGIWSQWMVHRLPVSGLPLVWAGLIGGVGVIGGLMRALIALWGPLADPLLVREEGLRRALMWAMVAVLVALGLVPHLLVRLSWSLW